MGAPGWSEDRGSQREVAADREPLTQADRRRVCGGGARLGGKDESTRSENLEQESLMEEPCFPHCARPRSRVPEGLLGGRRTTQARQLRWRR